MIAILLPALVALAGLLAYVLSTNAKITEIGRIMLWTGLLVSLFAVAHNWVKL